MTEHNCPCSTFGPGPHDADLRHPNPRGCEHAEWPETRLREAAESYRAAIRAHDENAMWFWAGEMAAVADRLDTTEPAA